MRRPQNGLSVTSGIRPPYTVCLVWRGRVIEARFVRTRAAALALAAEIQAQLAGLPVLDQSGPGEESEDEKEGQEAKLAA